jgi:hypothetical protein
MTDLQLDALVAEKVMGFTGLEIHNGYLMRPTGELGVWEGVPYYSEYIEAAWEVVEKLVSDQVDVTIFQRANHAVCAITTIDGVELGNVSSNRAPRAICLAALEAKDREAQDA